MKSGEMELTMKTSSANTMGVAEILFGSIMATASIYAAWCAVSLIILVLG